MTIYHYRKHFPSVAALVEQAKQAAPDWPMRRSSRTESAWFTKWAKTETFSHAVELAHGWHEGAARIEKGSARIKAKCESFRKVSVRAKTAPGRFVVADVLAGRPDPYLRRVNSKTPSKASGKVVRIAVNLCTSSAIGPETIERRGAAVLSLVNGLEKAGKRVEVIGVYSGVSETGRKLPLEKTSTLQLTFTIKAANARVNLPSLAFALAHPSMLRRILFAVREQTPSAELYALELHKDQGLFPRDVEPPAGALYLPGMSSDDKRWSNDESAARWVIDIAKSYGVELS